MKYLSGRDALALGLIALATRLFFAVAIDLPGLLGAGWIAALAACALSLPMAFCLHSLRGRWKMPPAEKFTGWAAKAFAAMLCLFCLYDAGCGLGLFTQSAQHTALEDMRPSLIIPVLALAATLGCLAGAQAVGSAARVTLRLLILLLILIVAVQRSAFNAHWLAPVLGPGAVDLAKPLPHLAGLLTGLVPLWLLKGADEKAPRALSLPALVGYIALVTALLLALFSMLSPILRDVPDTRLFSLHRLLTNGRVTAALQLVLLLAWYSGMMIALAFSLVCAARMLLIALPGLKWPWAVILCVLASLAVPIFSLAERQVIQWVNLARWPAVTLPVLGMALVQCIKDKRRASA